MNYPIKDTESLKVKLKDFLKVHKITHDVFLDKVDISLSKEGFRAFMYRKTNNKLDYTDGVKIMEMIMSVESV